MEQNKNHIEKNYKQIFKEFKKCKTNGVSNYRVAVAVYTILDCWGDLEECSNKEFDGLCNIVESIWLFDDDMPNACIEPIAFVVCDCYYNLERGFYNEDTQLSKKDLENLSEDKERALRLAVKKYLKKAIKSFKM